MEDCWKLGRFSHSFTGLLVSSDTWTSWNYPTRQPLLCVHCVTHWSMAHRKRSTILSNWYFHQLAMMKWIFLTL